jgi:hypothetical protein
VYICFAERGWSVSAAAPAHLHGHGHVHGLCDGRDDPRGALGIVEQSRARAGLRHLAHRAAEVDVHDVGAGVLDHPRGFGHQSGLRAEDLDGERPFLARDP